VKSHLKHIFVKLDVASRTEAIAIALQRGLRD
jgi:DNA-binding CsgD family transcriptional regulator